MIVIYRACSVGSPKNRPIEGKYELVEYCFNSFIKAFEGVEYELVVLLDKPNEKFRKLFEDYRVEETYYSSFTEGNVGSFHRQMDIALEHADKFLFVEDDYYFFPHAGKVLSECTLPFFSPYDHPDHYQNPLFISEREVLIDANHHWQNVLSTTLTFGGQYEALEQEHLNMREYGWADHPMWCDVTKRIPLYSPIPTLATHMEMEWLSKCVDLPFLQTS